MAPDTNKHPDHRVPSMPELVASLQQLHVEGDVGAAREKVEVGPKGTPNAVLGVFRFTDLSVELRDMILDQVILSTQHNGHKLSRLVVVNRTWQERIEKITFAKLGGFPGPCDEQCLNCPTCSASSPFQATDLRQFQRIVVGKRRTILRYIAIDFGLDAEGTPELQDHESPDGLGALADQTLGKAVAVRRCKRFGLYMNLLFRILHTWHASQAGPSYLDVEIRVGGILAEQYLGETLKVRANLTKLPHVSVIRRFELVHKPRARYYENRPRVVYYVHPTSINQILDRLPLLHSVVVSAQLPQPVPAALMAMLALMALFLTRRNRRRMVFVETTLRKAFLKLPEAAPATLKELVLKSSANDNPLFAFMRNGLTGRGDACFEAICDLGRRLEKLTLACSVPVERFLAYAVRSRPPSPWCYLSHFSIFTAAFHSLADIVRILDSMSTLVQRMPTLETFIMNLPVISQESDGPFMGRVSGVVAIKFEYIKTSNNDDHMLLAIHTPLALEMGSVTKWEHAAKQGRGVPLKASITESDIDLVEDSSEDEDGSEDADSWEDSSEED